MKTIPFLLCGVLVVAAAGRFNAEAEVRDRERALASMRKDVAEMERAVAQVRLDVEVLESASRLSELNGQYLSLRTVRADQLVDERAFAEFVGTHVPPKLRALPVDTDVIGNAISMADMRLAARATENAGSAE